MTIVGSESGRELTAEMKVAVVMGGAGFIGHHLARRLMKEGYWVRIVDLHAPQFSGTYDVCDDLMIADLRDLNNVKKAINLPWHQDVEVYQLAADMGGAGFVFTGENDADIMHNSAQINLNVAEACAERHNSRYMSHTRQASSGSLKIFYSSSACMYPERNQMDPDNPNCAEDSAYPADPDSEYGWEKLFSERLFMAYARNKGLDIRIARFHNIFGPEGTWEGGREKAPAAFCRKVAMAGITGTVEMWGDGEQTRSFLYIDECVEAVRRLMESDFTGPVNIGSEEMVSMNEMMQIVAEISSKRITVRHIEGPEGVRGRNSDNTLIREKLGWEPNYPLRAGLIRTYAWIAAQVEQKYGIAPPTFLTAGDVVQHVYGSYGKELEHAND